METRSSQTPATSSAMDPSAERWLQACRSAVAAQRKLFAAAPTIAGRSHYEGIGAGGDNTLVIDRECEDTVFAELEILAAEGHSFSVVSEERGAVEFGEPGANLVVVIDPIDGSLNARRTIPCHSLSIAVAEGPTMADVVFGFVHEFGADEEFSAVRGGGALLGDRTLIVPTEDGLEVIGMEATKPERVIAACRPLQGRAYRVRAPGSIAVALSYTAAARYDGMLSTRPCRSVDAAAAQLIATEAGASVAFSGEPAGTPLLNLDERFGIAAARTAADLEVLLEAQAAVG